MGNNMMTSKFQNKKNIYSSKHNMTLIRLEENRKITSTSTRQLRIRRTTRNKAKILIFTPSTYYHHWQAFVRQVGTHTTPDICLTSEQPIRLYRLSSTQTFDEINALIINSINGDVIITWWLLCVVSQVDRDLDLHRCCFFLNQLLVDLGALVTASEHTHTSCTHSCTRMHVVGRWLCQYHAQWFFVH